MEMERSDNKDNRRIGIYGGTFNPIHYGHLINIEHVREQFKLDKVIFIPDRIPVHKGISGCVSASDRFDMVNIAITGNDYFEASAIEIEREAPSYTIITINELRDFYIDDELFLIIGSDSYNELDTWKSYREILQTIHLIVMKRPGSTELRKDLPIISDFVHIFNNPLIEISSSMIRERIKQGHSVRYLTPDSVIDYIMRKGLYKIGS